MHRRSPRPATAGSPAKDSEPGSKNFAAIQEWNTREAYTEMPVYFASQLSRAPDLWVVPDEKCGFPGVTNVEPTLLV
jgi:hypothetical protein